MIADRHNYSPSPTDLGYINLAAAILRRAYFDYIDMLIGRTCYLCGRDSELEPSLSDLEKFFKSDYCQTISFGMGEELLVRAYKQALKTRASLKNVRRKTAYREAD